MCELQLTWQGSNWVTNLAKVANVVKQWPGAMGATNSFMLGSKPDLQGSAVCRVFV